MTNVAKSFLKFLVLFMIITIPTLLLIELGYLNAGDGEYIVPITMLCFLFGFRITFYQENNSKSDWIYRPLTLKDKVKLFLSLSGYLLLYELLLGFIRIKYS